MSRRIDATRLQVGQRIFARMAFGVEAATGYAMRVDMHGRPTLVTWSGRIVDLTRSDVTVEIVVPTDGHHAPWVPDPLPELLPTEVGSLILARRVREWGGGPHLLRLGDRGSCPAAWRCARTGDLVLDSEDIGDDWVQIDPETLRPVDGGESR